jgi:hypothetical protein
MSAVSRLAWILLLIALAGAVASLIGPHDRWWGIDVGATGAAVFGFALWLGAWLYSKNPERIFSAQWALAERRAWVGLVFLTLSVANFARFLCALGRDAQPPSLLREITSHHLMWNLFVLLISWAVVSSTISGGEPDVVERDERDLRFEYAADRVGDFALSGIVIACVILLATVPAERLDWWLAPLVAANVLIGLLMLKSLAEYVYLVSRYAWERR